MSSLTEKCHLTWTGPTSHFEKSSILIQNVSFTTDIIIRPCRILNIVFMSSESKVSFYSEANDLQLT